MRIASLAAAGVLLAGCAKEPVEVVQAPPPPELTRDDCYTVVLFDDVEVKAPGDEVPDGYHAFVGEWTNGAWDGKWCHDLLISEVRPDGSVELFDMHAPYEAWGQPATAFRRIGRIDSEGRLRFRYGTEAVTYELVDGALHARRSGRFGDLEAVLVNADAAQRDAAGVPVELAAEPATGVALASAPSAPQAAAAIAGFATDDPSTAAVSAAETATPGAAAPDATVFQGLAALDGPTLEGLTIAVD